MRATRTEAAPRQLEPDLAEATATSSAGSPELGSDARTTQISLVGSAKRIEDWLDIFDPRASRSSASQNATSMGTLRVALDSTGRQATQPRSLISDSRGLSTQLDVQPGPYRLSWVIRGRTALTWPEVWIRSDSDKIELEIAPPSTLRVTVHGLPGFSTHPRSWSITVDVHDLDGQRLRHTKATRGENCLLIAGLRPGTYELTAHASDVDTTGRRRRLTSRATRVHALGSGPPTICDLRVQPTARLRMTSKAAVDSVAVCDVSGSVLARARMLGADPGIVHLPPDRYRLRYAVDGRVREHTIHIPPGGAHIDLDRLD